ncbi:hypothetical protein GCM10010129_18760 [Streptomyces fumigatiscleroticus]|nr:hypothetical protein GCM10010129_18760 [Streptomyces fumigatiscleroticus]
MSNDGGGTGVRGRLVGGRYRLAERIGSGGMGTVWRATDELVQREVALKEPRIPGDPQDEGHRRAAHRLYREARAAARVDHPAAVSIHDVVVEEQDGPPWIVMELVRGESLHELLGRGPLPPAETARIGLAVLGALRAAHAVGIVHRDVKPANVLLGPHGRVVLTDFGIAHVQGEESLTATGEFVGSLEFVAPERMSGRVAGPASDLWSLGVLLYAAVEGRSPFRRTTVESTLAAVLAAEPPEPERAGPLAPLITGLLAKDPDRRPDPDEITAALEEATRSGDRTTAPSPVGPEDCDVSEGPDEHDESEDVQRTDYLEQVTPDTRTVRLSAGAAGAAGAPGAPGAPGAAGAADVPVQAPPPRRRGLRPAPLALLGALLLVGGISCVALLADGDSGTAAEGTATTRPAASSAPAAGVWTAHREKELEAVLSLPSEYRAYARQGDEPRYVVYDVDGTVLVRLSRWDRAPGSPMDRAQSAHDDRRSEDDEARTQYTRTSFHGQEAVLADTTYRLRVNPTRVMQLVVRTDDDRMYELRVDMPKGTPDEKKGTALFKGARDRLRIEAG